MTQHRYQAPRHVAEVFTPSGPQRANRDGVITLPDDAPAHDHQALRVAGCAPIQAGAPIEPQTAAKAPRKPASKPKGPKAAKPARPAKPPAAPASADPEPEPEVEPAS